MGGEYTFFFLFFSFVRALPCGNASASRPYFFASARYLTDLFAVGQPDHAQPSIHTTAQLSCGPHVHALKGKTPFWKPLFHKSALSASLPPSNTTHATCHHGDDWQGTQAALIPTRTGASRQVRHACATQRHFLWGAEWSRAGFQLLAITLTDVLRVPQTKRCVNEEAATNSRLIDGEDDGLLSFHAIARVKTGSARCMSAPLGAVKRTALRLPWVSSSFGDTIDQIIYVKV